MMLANVAKLHGGEPAKADAPNHGWGGERIQGLANAAADPRNHRVSRSHGRTARVSVPLSFLECPSRRVPCRLPSALPSPAEANPASALRVLTKP